MSFNFKTSSVFFIVLCVSTASPQSEEGLTPGLGAVAGQVIDVHSRQPVSQATVVAERDDEGVSGKLPFATTDDTGKFLISGLSPGRYVIAASKEGDNYPDTDSAAFAADLAALPKVSVREGQVTGAITVPVAKGGKLIGLIADADTHEPVIHAHIRLTRADNTKLWLRTGPDIHGHFQLVVPSRPFLVEVTADGYRPWNLRDRSLDNVSGYVQVEPEATKELNVLLKKDQ